VKGLLAAILLISSSASAEVKPCGISLSGLSRTSGAPGETLELLGVWGEAQDAKLPMLRGIGAHKLEVLSWGGALIKVRIPEGVKPGMYRVGVFCDEPEKNPNSSGFKEFGVAGAGERTRVYSSPKTAAFLSEWKAKGRLMKRDKRWLDAMTLTVFPLEGGAAREKAEAVAASLRAQLAESGSKKLKVAVSGALPEGFSACVKDDILDRYCLQRALDAARAAGGAFAGTAPIFITSAAIGLKPKGIIGPPAGVGSYPGGWVLISLFWDQWNRQTYKDFHNPPGFDEHSLDGTVRHELFHMLGLPHHEVLENPGFPESKLCTECSHQYPGGHKDSPHRECQMDCGASDDDWRHAQVFGKGFGFCDKCSAAARAVIDGIEEAAP
jgi:hypothetical protein